MKAYHHVINRFPGRKDKRYHVFKHRSRGNTSVFEDSGSFQDLLQLILHHSIKKTPITLNFGYAECSPKDHYSRRIGREEADKTMKPTQFDVSEVVFSNNEVIYPNDSRFPSEWYVNLCNEQFLIQLKFRYIKKDNFMTFRIASIEKRENE